MQQADLHLHSSASDGRYAPREVIRRAHGAGLAAVALTDHDTVAGLDEARREAGRLGIQLVPGCEISIDDRGVDVHLLAYYIDDSDAGLRKLLGEMRIIREERARRMVEKLTAAGLPIAFEDVRAEAISSDAIGRAHVAQALVRKGLVGTIQKAFSAFIGNGGIAYVGKGTRDAADVLQLVWLAGGVPVLAHPGLYGLADAESFFADWDLGGIEIDHPSHPPPLVPRLAAWAKSRGLLATAGSDWHGDDSASTYVGSRSVGVDVVEALRAMRRSDPAAGGRVASGSVG